MLCHNKGNHLIINDSSHQNKEINIVMRPLIPEKWLDGSNADFVVSCQLMFIWSIVVLYLGCLAEKKSCVLNTAKPK